jgi:hypothetical protein
VSFESTREKGSVAIVADRSHPCTKLDQITHDSQVAHMGRHDPERASIIWHGLIDVNTDSQPSTAP